MTSSYPPARAPTSPLALADVFRLNETRSKPLLTWTMVFREGSSGLSMTATSRSGSAPQVALSRNSRMKTSLAQEAASSTRRSVGSSSPFVSHRSLRWIRLDSHNRAQRRPKACHSVPVLLVRHLFFPQSGKTIPVLSDRE